MSLGRYLTYFRLAHFSQPVADRVIYRAVRAHKPRSIVELGIGAGQRFERLIDLAKRYGDSATMSYTGIDLFEARPAGSPGLSLKEAHRRVKTLGIKSQLVPGDPLSALTRCANGLAGTDLVIISADQESESLRKAWFYVPRMIHPKSLIFQERRAAGSGASEFILLTPAQVEQLAREAAPQTHRRAA